MDSDPPKQPRELFRKSKRSTEGNTCVEIYQGPDAVWMRDSKNDDSPQLMFPHGSWTAFIDVVKDGGMDR